MYPEANSKRIDGDVRPAGDRGEVAAGLGRRAGVRGPEPRPGRARGAPEQDVRGRDAPLPVGRASHGACAQLHDRRRARSPAPAARDPGAAPDGIRRLRSACRERGDQGRCATRARSPSANIATIREQMQRMGWAIDWSRELSTHDPAYYRWTQWLFLRFFERGLAYRKEAPVKWCPKDQTVLANEQVIDGRCERCGTEVEAKNLTQWFFRITDYADELLDEMDLLEQLARADADDAAQLDRPLAGRPRPLPRRRERGGAAGLHHPAGHALRRHVLRARPRAPARAAARRGHGARGGGPRLRAPHCRPLGGRA